MVTSLNLGLEHSVVVVTGAAGQIGRVIVQTFLEAGCFGVVGLDVDTTDDAIQHENLFWERVDVTDESEMQNVWAVITKRFGRVPTVCVHAAALDLSFVPHFSSMSQMPVEQFVKTMTVNTVGTFITAKIWLKALQEENNSKTQRNISFIMMGSEAGTFGVLGNPDYSASKAALVGLCLSMAPDVARIGGRVNVVAPGAVDTPQFQRECLQDSTGKSRWIDAEATVALRKPVDMKHVARLCLTLASDEWSGSTSGQIIQPNGGKSGRVFWDVDGQPVT